MSAPEASGDITSIARDFEANPQDSDLEGWISTIFRESPVGIIRSDLSFNLIYANKKAMEILGVTSWENLKIVDFVPNQETFRLFEEKLANRQRGLSEEYEVEVLRQSDGQRLPVKITAMPVTRDGKVTGVMSLIRSLALEQASQSIDRCIQTAHDTKSLLSAIADQTRRAIPFDACTVSLYSRDESHSRVIFSDDPALLDLYAMRWFRMSSAQKTWGQQKEIVIVPDVPSFIMQMDSEYKERSMRVLKKLEWRSFIRYPVIRENKVVGAFSLAKRIVNGYTEADKKTLEALPLDTALATALHFQEVKDLQFRLGLIHDVLHGDTNEKIFDLLVTRLSAHYEWQCVHVFSVNESDQTLKLEAQHADLTSSRLPDGYRQGFDEGILGYVRRNRTTVNVSNVRADPQFSNLFIKHNGATVSELSIPITVGGEVRAILNIEDKRESAFLPEEVDAITLVLKEVEGVIERFRSERLISASYAATPSAVWVIDRRGRIKRANPSAQKLLGFTEQQMVGTFIADYFKDRELGKALVRSPEPVTSEVILVSKSKSLISILLGGSQLESEFAGERVITGRDLRGHKRAEQIQLLEQLFYEIATQAKTPLLLATDWIRRIKDRPDSSDSTDLAEKALKQLQKAEITYERLALFDQNGATMPYHPVLVNIQDLIKDCVGEFPSSETQMIRIESADEPFPLIRGDLYQLGFVIKSTLSYLIRFSTECSSVGIRTAKGSESITVTMVGPSGSVARSGPHRRKGDEIFARTLSEMALGRATIERFVRNHGGIAHKPSIQPDSVSFCYELPIER